MSHTSGPWKPSSYEGWDCVRDEKGTILCKLVYNCPDNAVMMAAAPDLYEACMLLVAIAYEKDAPSLFEIRKAIYAARDAVKKAKGKP